MQAVDELLTIAEIAVALIGFSGLISVFTARSAQELVARDLAALAMIIGSGSGVLCFALFPLPLPYFGLADASVWRVSAGVFAAVLLAGTGLFVWVDVRLVRAGHEERTPVLNRISPALFGLCGLALAASAAGWLPTGPGPYLAALLVCLALCLTFVGFLLVVARRVRRG